MSNIPVLVGEHDAVVYDVQVHASVQTALELLKPRGIQIESRALPIHAKSQLMSAPPVHGRKVRIRNPLLTVGIPRQIDEVVAPLSGRENLKNLLPLRDQLRGIVRRGGRIFAARLTLRSAPQQAQEDQARQ